MISSRSIISTGDLLYVAHGTQGHTQMPGVYSHDPRTHPFPGLNRYKEIDNVAAIGFCNIAGPCLC